MGAVTEVNSYLCLLRVKKTSNLLLQVFQYLCDLNGTFHQFLQNS